MINVLNRVKRGEKLTLKISGMHCTSCAMNIDGALEDLAGVFRAETSYARNEVSIEFDPKKVNKDLLIQTIQTEGYQVVEYGL